MSAPTDLPIANLIADAAMPANRLVGPRDLADKTAPVPCLDAVMLGEERMARHQRLAIVKTDQAVNRLGTRT